MDGSRFDDLLRALAKSRRALFGGTLAATAGWLGAGVTDAKKKRKHKHKRKKKVKPATPNEFGCLEVSDACNSEEQCCSGICEGKKGKKTCRAHDTGTCKQDGQVVPCNNRTDCGCFRTTAGSDVCAELFGPSECAVCQKDADCAGLGFPPGSACGYSFIPCEGGAMACYVPCGKAAVEA